MNLESAREIKSRILAEHLPAFAIGMMRDCARTPEHVDVERIEPSGSVALGITPTGQDDYRIAIRVQRSGLASQTLLERVARLARGEMEVRRIRRAVKLGGPWYQRNCRPLNIGASVGHINVAAGSIGAFVKKKGSPHKYILSNNHVLANENTGVKGDEIIQRGLRDGGRATRDTVATLDSFVKLETNSPNFVDCAIAKVLDRHDCDETTMRDLLGPGIDGELRSAAEIGQIDIRAPIRKIGRTTGATVGRISAFEMDNIVLNYDLGEIRFDRQIEIESASSSPFADVGDSGAIIVSDEGQAVGLLIGAKQSSSRVGPVYANPIQAALHALNAELVV